MIYFVVINGNSVEVLAVTTNLTARLAAYNLSLDYEYWSYNRRSAVGVARKLAKKIGVTYRQEAKDELHN